MLERSLAHGRGAVPVVQVEDVRRRDTGDRTGETVLHCCHQRRHVAAERQSPDADRCVSTDEARPGDQGADIPRRLGKGVHGVDQVDGHEALATGDTGLLAGPVEGQDRHRQVQSQLAVQAPGAKCPQVEERRTGTEAVHTDDPGATRVGLAQDPGVGGAVGIHLEPTLSPGLASMGLVVALEAEVLVGLAQRPLSPG